MVVLTTMMVLITPLYKVGIKVGSGIFSKQFFKVLDTDRAPFT
jgi:hypothetical protein